jgi:hypothetical protein
VPEEQWFHCWNTQFLEPLQLAHHFRFDADDSPTRQHFVYDPEKSPIGLLEQIRT